MCAKSSIFAIKIAKNIFEYMKHFLCSLFVVAALLTGIQTADAQPRPTKQKIEFTNDDFPSQLGAVLNGATKVEEKVEANNKLMRDFGTMFNNMEASKQAQVVAMFQAVSKTKLAVLPDYYDLTEAVMEYRKSNVTPTLFSEWLKAVQDLTAITTKTKEITGFVEYSRMLLAERTLYKSRTSIWSVQAGAKFSFAATKHDIKTVFDSPMELYYSSGTAANDDHNTIYNTKGAYYFLENRWLGDGGRLTWERCGVDNGVCYAELQMYDAITKFPKFSADSVLFVNTNYFKKPIRGEVQDALSNKMENEKYTFPKFRSYQKDFQLKDVLPGVDFEGSFMMYGPRFVTNDEKNPASMVMYRGGKRFMVISSTKFSILPNMLTSERASVKMYIGNDSICNTGVLIRYTTKDQRVNMINNTKRNYYSPYTDSYHQLDIYCESINWMIEKDVVEFTMVAQSNTQTNVTFESNRYYSQKKDREITGIDQVSPVVRVYRYMKAHDMKRDFSLTSFMNAIKMDEAQTKLMIHGLSKSGLLSYDEGNGRVHVHDKLIGFYKAIVKEDGHDYDAITLESTATSGNAELDLATNDLRIHGVKKFVVSDSQLVVVKPYGGNITVKRNRDIEFSGHINVGRFEMDVTNASFFYDAFRFDLPQIDSLRFYVASFTEKDKQKLVRTPLYNLVGDIQIDKSDNHCGLKKNKEYPIFNSAKPSYVYYDRKDIFNGVYSRDRFYYLINPFVIRQLTEFSTDSLEFNGVLTSAGIFPDIPQPLKVMRDYSLGFINRTPSGGYPAYGGKGTYYDTVALSYGGLRGKGRLEYLAATAVTDKYIFMPDSMQSLTDTFYVKEKDDFPDIRNGKTMIRWYPYTDSMTVSQLLKGTPFAMYHGQTQLSGRVTLQPKGAAGTGTAVLHDGTLRSPWFELRTKVMDAAVTEFRLRSAKYDELAFKAKNMKSHVDYEEHTGLFTSNDSLERTQLAALGYAAWVDQYTWDWDHKFLALDNSKSLETQVMEAVPLRERAKRLASMPGARFESTDPKLKNIRFSAINSNYRYDDLELASKNVFALPIADALIAPGGDSLHISKGGAMSLIKNGQLLAARGNGYHLFYNCDLMVADGARYSGKGTIDYVSEDEKKQPIYMNEISVNDTGMTVANGFVDDSARFTLSEAFGFAGKVRVEAQRPNYYFDGGIRLLHKCAPMEQLGLLAYADYLDPENIRVVVPETPVDWQGHRIHAAICMDQNTLKPTSAFLTKQQSGTELLSSYGLLHYDSQTDSYTITSERVLDGSDEVDRHLTMNMESCVTEGEGPITFGLSNGPASIYAFGNVYLDPNNTEDFKMNTVFGLNFPIDNGLLSQMASQIENDLRPMPADRDNDLLRRALAFGMGMEDGNDAYLTYQGTGAFSKMPKCIDNTFLFENVKWEYSPQRGYTANCTSALCNVGKKQLHVNVKLKAQYFKKGGENIMIVYMQLANDHWYYMKYEQQSQKLSITSSVGEWNDKLLAIDKDKRKVETFSYVLANSRTEIQNFLTFFSGGTPDMEEEEE